MPPHPSLPFDFASFGFASFGYASFGYASFGYRLRTGRTGRAGKEGKEKVDIVNKLVNTYKDDKRHCRDDHTTIVIPNLPFSVILANARIQCCSLRKAEEKAKALDPLLDWIHSLIGSPIRSGTTSVEDDRKRQRKKQNPGSFT